MVWVIIGLWVWCFREEEARSRGIGWKGGRGLASGYKGNTGLLCWTSFLWWGPGLILFFSMAEDVETGGIMLRRFCFEAVIYSAQEELGQSLSQRKWLAFHVMVTLPSSTSWSALPTVKRLSCDQKFGNIHFQHRLPWAGADRRSSDLSLTGFARPEGRLQTL